MRVMVVAVLLIVAGPLAAQVPIPADSVSAVKVDASAMVSDSDSSAEHLIMIETGPDTLAPVLDHTLSGPGDYIRFWLTGRVEYRVRVTNSDLTLTVEPVLPAISPVTVIELDRFPDATGERNYLVRAGVDGEYQFRALFTNRDTTAQGAAVPLEVGSMRLRVYRRTGTGNLWTDDSKVSWDYGLALAGGSNGEYPIAGTAPATGSSRALEGCLEARYGPGVGRLFGGCLLGISYESRPGSNSATWYFVEPHVRLLGYGERWQRRLDVGILFRAGLGHITGASHQPGILAPGAYLSYLLAHHGHSPRIVIEGALRIADVLAGGQPTQRSMQGTVGLGIF